MICIFVCTHTCVCVCFYVPRLLWDYVYVYVKLISCKHIFMYVHAFIHTFMYVCMFVYYICTNVHMSILIIKSESVFGNMILAIIVQSEASNQQSLLLLIWCITINNLHLVHYYQ